MLKTELVDIGQSKVASSSSLVFYTHPLGATVAITAYDPTAKAGGMMHFILPSSLASSALTDTRPGIFADTGLDDFLKKLAAQKCVPDRLIIKIIGGASFPQPHDFCGIAEINLKTAQTLLNNSDLKIANTLTGGHDSVSARFDLSTGKTFVECAQNTHTEI